MDLSSSYQFDFNGSTDVARRDGFCAIYGLFDATTGALRYIGRARDPRHRLRSHLALSARRPTHKDRWIRAQLRRGVRPSLRVLAWVAVEAVADAEIACIAQARVAGYDLTNVTLGGEGAWGWRHDAQQRALMVERSRQLWQCPEYRRRVMTARARACATAEDRERRVRTAVRLWQEHPGLRQERSEQLRARWQDAQYHARVTAHVAQANQTPAAKARRAATEALPQVRAKRVEHARRLWQNAAFRIRASALVRQQWQDPALRAKMIEGRWTPQARQDLAEQARARWQDPACRARMLDRTATDEQRAAMAERSRQWWADPAYRAHITAAITACQQSAEQRALRSALARERWEDPAYRASVLAAMNAPERRAATSERMRERWQDPQWRAKIAATAPEERTRRSVKSAQTRAQRGTPRPPISQETRAKMSQRAKERERRKREGGRLAQMPVFPD